MRYRPCGGRWARFAAGAAGQERGQVVALQHRADQGADHVAQERVGRDLEGDDVLVELDPTRARDRARERPVLRLGRRERAEVVSPSSDCAFSLAPRGRADAGARANASLRAPSARGGATRGSGRSAIARRSARGSRPAPARHARPRCRAAARVDRGHARSGGGPPSTSTDTTFASACTPASVRPATTSSPAAVELAERAPQLALDRALARLARPAAEVRAVVLDR